MRATTPSSQVSADVCKTGSIYSFGGNNSLTVSGSVDGKDCCYYHRPGEMKWGILEPAQSSGSRSLDGLLVGRTLDVDREELLNA